MRTLGIILISSLGLIFPWAQNAVASPLSTSEDSLRVQAVRLVEKTLDELRHSRDLNPFKHRFGSNAAQHPCDVCPEMTPVPVEQYVFQVLESHPDTFMFRTRIDNAHIEVEHDAEGNAVRISVPFTKWVTLPAAQGGKGQPRTRTVHLIAKVRVDPASDVSLETIVLEVSPGAPITFVEGSIAFALGGPAYDNAIGLAPESTGIRYGLGVVRYFNPFHTPNRGNIWLKAGLRLVWSTTRLSQDELSILKDDVSLTPATTPSEELPEQIDLTWQVRSIEERIEVLALEVPLGVSKRWRTGERTQFVLDLGVAVGYELTKGITGRYNLDQHGSDHRIDGYVMGTSTGEPLIYTEPDAAVMTKEDGQRIDFFSDRQYVLDDIVLKKGATFSFGLTPSMLFRSKHGRNYRIGLDLSMTNTRTAAVQDLDETYFLSSDDPERPAISEMSNGGFTPWLGLILAIEL